MTKSTQTGAQSYVVVQQFMVEAGLKGAELLAYAIIYGFCQDGRSACRCSRAYFAWWLGISKRQVSRVLDALEQRGLIRKAHEVVDGVTLPRYYLGPAAPAVSIESVNVELAAEAASAWAGGRETPAPLSHAAEGAPVPSPTQNTDVENSLDPRDEGAGTRVRGVVTHDKGGDTDDKGGVIHDKGGDTRNVENSSEKPSSEGGVVIGDKGGCHGCHPIQNRTDIDIRTVSGTGDVENSDVENSEDVHRRSVAEKRAAVEAARKARPEAWEDYQGLRGLVPTTRGFDFGFPNFVALLDEDWSIDQISRACAQLTEDFAEQHPGRPDRFKPHAERLLHPLNSSEGVIGYLRAAQAARRGPDDDELYRHALLAMGGELGREAARLNDDICAARAELWPDEESSEALDAAFERRARWVECHRDEIEDSWRSARARARADVA